MTSATQVCTTASGGDHDSPAGNEGGPVTHYQQLQDCEARESGVCANLMECTTASGEPGYLHSVYTDGVLTGYTCLGEAEAVEAAVVTPGLVLRAFRELAWPASSAVIEPPDGLTLVNLDTNFHTTSTRPLTQTVTLLAQSVTIEATPASWTWDYGDGEQVTTEDPGAPYPDLRVTHAYTRVGTYAVTLATTYTGRFRVAAGPWQAIPDTHTVPGPAQQVRAIEATPQLVGH